MYSKVQQLSHNKNKKLRKKKCKTCKEWFIPKSSFQVVCESVDCAVSYAKKEMVKKQNQTKKAFNQSDKSKLKEKAQFWFNKFIRLRDKNLPCISCGHTQGRQFHAGHFRPVGANQQLRFNEFNCHKQCSICNNYKSGNLADYRINLINRIGLENVEALEKDNSVKKYSEVELKEIIETYKNKCKELENELF